MIAAVLGALLAAAPVQTSGFERALELVGERRFLAALDAADRERDELRRAQARVYVLVAGRDFAAALAAARAGLAIEPADPWLLERAAACALALEAPGVAAEMARALAAALPGAALEPDRRAELARAADLHLAAAEDLVERDRRAGAGLRRARSLSLGVLLLCGTGLVLLARRSKA